MKYFISIILGLLSMQVMAVTNHDFAYGYSLEVDGDGAVYSLYLNDDIYKGIVQSDRADIRVFNSQGIAVPHYIRRNEQQIEKVEILDSVEPPFFPLYKDGQPEANEKYNVHITTNDQGSIIDINYGSKDPQKRVLAGYIIDTSKLTHIPARLTLEWSGEQSDFVGALQIESSDDLSHWQTLVTRATISHLQYGQHTLVQNSVDLPLRKAKYLRLNWLGKYALPVEKMTLAFADLYTVEAQPRQWSDFSAPRFDLQSNTYYFDTHSLLPIDRVNVTLPQRNTLVSVNIESAKTEQGPWTSRYQGLLYDLQQEGEHLHNPDIMPMVNSHRYWRLHVYADAGQLGGEPVLRLGWIPEQLLFIAQGEAPFTLAFGSARVSEVSYTLSQLIGGQSPTQQDKLIKSARLGTRVELGDESRLQPEKPPRDWKGYTLWAVLILGVLLLSYMVLRLYKQMDQSPPAE
jgi:hypothetical protein